MMADLKNYDSQSNMVNQSLFWLLKDREHHQRVSPSLGEIHRICIPGATSPMELPQSSLQILFLGFLWLGGGGFLSTINASLEKEMAT